MPKSGGKRKKSRTHVSGTPQGAQLPDSEKEVVPRSIIVKIGKVNPMVRELVHDMRRLMGPYTASNLQEKKFNKIKDYTAVLGQLDVSHLMSFTQTEKNIIMRVGRHPDGPTLHFVVRKFMPPRVVKASQKHPFESEAAFHTSPVLVLNNFNQSDDPHIKLMKVTFQHMYRTINVNTVKLGDCRRVVLYHFTPETGMVEMRHYAIRANPVGISRNIKKVIQSKIPDLGDLEDISEFVDGAIVGAMSDSEAEDDSSKVTLPDRFVGRGNAKAQLSAMKLTELGPRLTLELYKVEQGLHEGDILYHRYVQKSPAEAKANKDKVNREKMMKEQRKAVQEANIKRKRDAIEEKKRLREERKKRRLESGEAATENDGDEDIEDDMDEDDEGEDYPADVEDGMDDDAHGDDEDDEGDEDGAEMEDEYENEDENEDEGSDYSEDTPPLLLFPFKGA